MMSANAREQFLTLFKIGYFKSAPGTWASFVAMLIGSPILYYASEIALLLFAALICAIGIKEINIYEAENNSHDESHIVIDEVVGMFIAMGIANLSVISVILAFIFFRIYDIFKPSIIGKIDEEVGGGLGVMGDDVLAGFFAGLSSLVIVGIFNIFF